MAEQLRRSNTEKAILLIEDSPDDEFLFKQILKTNGITTNVMVVRDGQEALDYLEGKGKFADRAAYPMPTAVFVDLGITKLSGLDVLARIKEQPISEGLLRVVLTHHGDVKNMRAAYELGAQSFCVKPLSHADLGKLIRHYSNQF